MFQCLEVLSYEGDARKIEADERKESCSRVRKLIQNQEA